MFNDDILNEFAKLALEKGLIKSAEESKELKNYKDDSYPRVGSDTKEVIEGLYGFRPDMPEEMKYEHNISEVAHPNQVILHPSYDKMHGRVENINERQQFLINLMRKPVNGFHIQKKYAESELTHSLVSIANDMDNRDIDQLRILADACVEQIRKEALFPLLGLGPLAWAGVAAGVLGAAYLYNHINDPDKGLLANVNNAIQQVDDLIGEDWFHQTFYATLKPEFIHNLQKFRMDLQHLKDETERFNNIETQVHSLKTYDEIKQTAETSGQEIVQKAEEFRSFLQNIAPEIKQAIDLFSSTDVRNLAIKDETWFSGLVSKIEPIFHGGWGLFSDRFDDIKQALAPLKISMDATVEEINRLDQTADKRKQALEQADKQRQSYAPKKSVEMTPVEEQAQSQNLKPEDLKAIEEWIK